MGRTLAEDESSALLAAFGVPVAPAVRAADADAAVGAARAIGYPVVAKLVGDAIAHKTERGLVRLGLLQGDVDKLIETEAYKPFYMHRTSHWLGMDVHDVGGYYVGGKARPLAPGMVLTVEPGIYIGKDYEKVPAEWRGIGVRIEDDILVTDGAPENLTSSIPKTVKEVEHACAA